MTLPMETVTKIRRLHFAEHWKVGTISAQLGVHHDAVKRALGLDTRGGIKPDGLGATRVLALPLDAYKPFIRETFEKYPRLTAMRVFQMVKGRGYLGGYEAVKRYARVTRPTSTKEAFFRLETMPGEQAQVDWGLFGKVQVGRAKRGLCCFVMVLSYSRAIFARFFLDMALENFLRGHVLAFEALGGVPREILFDNLKSVVLERNGDAIRFHPRLLDLAGHYHFAPKPCAPYRGNEKGKVERTIRYLRDSFFAARKFRDVDDLNSQLSRWIRDVAMVRPWPATPDGRRVVDVLAEEKPRLLALPGGEFSTEVMRGVASGKTPYVRFDGNDYSLPHSMVRKPLTLLASENIIRIVDGTNEVARHVRSYDKGQRIENRTHFEGLAAQKRHASEIRGRDVLRTLLKQADAFMAALALRNVSMSHETLRLIKMVQKYGAAEVDRAMAEALTKGAISAASVGHLLEAKARGRKLLPAIDVVVPESVQHLRVSAHALADYDELLDNGGTP